MYACRRLFLLFHAVLIELSELDWSEKPVGRLPVACTLPAFVC